MKKKISIFFGSISLVVVCLAMMFSLTSKRPPNFEEPPIPCDDQIRDNMGTAFLQINFDPSAQNPFRRAGYESYIPSPDIRFGDIDGTGFGVSDVEYACSVTLTSPQCSEWVWTGFMSDQNTTSGGKMTIPMPPSNYDLNVKVEYSEKGESNKDPNFNIPLNGNDFTSVVYTFEMTYLGGWSSNIPQPIYLRPSHQISGYCMNNSCGKGSVKRSVRAKDYGNINEYLDAHGLFGH